MALEAPMESVSGIQKELSFMANERLRDFFTGGKVVILTTKRARENPEPFKFFY